MKLLQTLRKYFRLMGIQETRISGFLQKYPINAIHRYFLSGEIALTVLSLFWFIIFEAKSFEEFVEIATVITGIGLTLVCYLAFAFEVKNFIEIQNDLKRMVHQSEYLS